MPRVVWASALLLAAAAVTAAAGQRSTADKPRSLLTPSLVGRDNFNAYCSPCHGRDATGNGPVASALKTRPSDLTRLAKRAGGAYPSARVQAFITNGGANIAAHGSSEMPVWGPTFLALEPSDTLVKIRIANVVAYVESLQVK
jgi:mono/diheme cytochrome c family protein